MTEDTEMTGGAGPPEDPPPFGRSWAALYAAVLLTLALMVVLFYVFTRVFS